MIGRVFGGRYEIIQEVNSGGMAHIFKAFCKKTKTVVALKILKEKFSLSAEYVTRFKKEAQATFSLDHENIVRVRDIGFDDGVYYMVMDYIEGSCLKALIEREKIIDEKDAVLYAVQVCSALSAAHKKGIIHRDIKPHNILLDISGNIKLTDFGIAKSIGVSQEKENQVIGSVYYISPEQARGEEVDARSDIYSLGIVLYEMLTGELPFAGEKTVSVALKHLNEQITAPISKNPKLSAAINYIVLKATSKNPKERYRTADAFKEDLLRALADPQGAFAEQKVRQYMDQKTIAEKHKKNKTIKICILAALILAITASAVFGISLLTPSSHKALTVPNLYAQDAGYAFKVLADMGFSVEVTYEPSEVIKEGFIISQSPEPESCASFGSAVSLVVSLGPAALTMPDLYGAAINDALNIIEEMGLILGEVVYEPRDDIPSGTVISQSLFADTVIEKGDTIMLVVSGTQSPEGISMPQLTGLNVQQAVKMLNDAGFTYCLVYEEDSQQSSGTVTSQSPQQGIQTLLSNRVDLWISAFTDKRYCAVLRMNIDISEPGSFIRTVLEVPIDGTVINIAQEWPASETGLQMFSFNLSSIIEGMAPVRIYVNNELISTQEVEFVDEE
ncbi:MAG: protein kinase [Christensenellales bacterium]